MNREEWIAFLSTLDEKCRRLSQSIILRAQHILNKDRIAYLDDIQRVERRQTALKDELRYLEERLSARIAALEQQAGHGA
jgi:hypothetical protein